MRHHSDAWYLVCALHIMALQTIEGRYLTPHLQTKSNKAQGQDWNAGQPGPAPEPSLMLSPGPGLSVMAIKPTEGLPNCLFKLHPFMHLLDTNWKGTRKVLSVYQIKF